MAGPAFKFGFEVELFLNLRDTPDHSIPNLETFAKGLVQAYNTRKGSTYPRMHADIDGQYEGSAEFRDWSLTDDVTITQDRPKCCMQYLRLAQEFLLWLFSAIQNQGLILYSGPIEIVSPIMKFDDENWRSHVAEVWNIIRLMCLIETDQSCGTHVHISPPGNQAWDLGSLQNVCYSILYFEGAFEALLPPERRGNQWTKSNRVDNPKFYNRTLIECFKLINQCSNNVEIANLMNNGGDRFYGWNFLNLFHGGKMTIEFRRGPGITRAQECLNWVEFAVTFVRAAKRVGAPEKLVKITDDVKGLERFVEAGMVKGMNIPDLLKPIFKGKSGRLDPIRVGHLSAQKKKKEDQKKHQDQKKNLMVKKIKSIPGNH